MSTGTPLTGERLERWRAAQPLGWRGVVVPVVLWVAVIALATALSQEGGCTLEDPCGPDWVGGVEVPMALAAPVALLWWPPVGAVISLVAAVLFLVVERDLGVLDPWLSTWLPLLVVAATLHAEVWRQRRRNAAAELLREAPVSPFPGPVPPPPAVPPAAVVAAGCLVVAALLLGYGIVHGRGVAAEERLATTAVGTVVSHADDGYVITVEWDGDRHEIDTLDADDYPVGSEQHLLIRPGGEVGLAVERYDPSGWSGGALALALFAVLLGGRALTHWRATRRLLEQPQPVLDVRVGWAVSGAHVLAADMDTDPLLELDLVSLDPAPEPDGADTPVTEPATLYGVPLVGEACALVLRDGVRLVPVRRAKRGDPGWREQVVDIDPFEEDQEGDTAAPRASEVVAWREELTRPETSRLLVGLLVVATTLVGAFLVARHSHGVGTTLFRCVILAMFAFSGLVQLVSRVHLTPAALVHDGPTTRRTVPWRAIERITVVDDDIVLARLSEGEMLPLPWLPHRPVVGRKARRREWARRWGAVLAAQVAATRDAPVRPVSVEPRLHGAVVAIAFTAAVLLGLASRGAL